MHLETDQRANVRYDGWEEKKNFLQPLYVSGN